MSGAQRKYLYWCNFAGGLYDISTPEEKRTNVSIIVRFQNNYYEATEEEHKRLLEHRYYGKHFWRIKQRVPVTRQVIVDQNGVGGKYVDQSVFDEWNRRNQRLMEQAVEGHAVDDITMKAVDADLVQQQKVHAARQLAVTDHRGNPDMKDPAKRPRGRGSKKHLTPDSVAQEPATPVPKIELAE